MAVLLMLVAAAWAIRAASRATSRRRMFAELNRILRR